MHLVRGGADGIGLCRAEHTKVPVDRGAAALHQRQRAYQFQGHALRGDAEILQGALRLRAPQPIGRDRDFAEAVPLDAESR